MTDPLRWTDEGADASALERELLSEGQGMGLSDAQKQRSWASILLHAAPGAAVSGAGTAAFGSEAAASAAEAAASAAGAAAGSQSLAPLAAQAASWGWGSKIVGVASLCGVLGGAYWATLQSDVPADLPQRTRAAIHDVVSADEGRAVAPSVMHQAPSVTPERASVRLENAPVVDVSEPSSREDSAQSSPSAVKLPKAQAQVSEQQKRASRLREESLAVLEIRQTLRAGNASRALSLLEQTRKDFPDGVLGQEREALTIEALVSSGARELAQKRAQTFLKNYPQSPFAADVTRVSQP